LRSQFELRGDAPVFLFTFDCNSSIARKNPMGVVEAFARAFPHQGPDSPILILKTINLEHHSGFERNLRAGMAAVNGTVLNGHLSQQQMANLFHACDVYVSLHRSEGFGLGMAEAMAIGKPVIGTGYSGNIDFMNGADSCLVGYRLRPINNNDYEDAPGMSSVYTEGTLWAEPDLDQAAQWMQILASDEPLRNRIGASAKAAMASFSEEVVSRIAVARLTTLASELRG
jgi:glycosyltransferase involved in cell wall biosynthesis